MDERATEALPVQQSGVKKSQGAIFSTGIRHDDERSAPTRRWLAQANQANMPHAIQATPPQSDNETYGEVSGVGGNGCKPVCLVKLYRT
jgi:hypothetical protein